MSEVIVDIKKNDSAIKKFFSNPILDFREYPDEEIAAVFQKPQKKFYKIDLSVITSEVKRKEYSDYLYCIFVGKADFSWNTDKTNYIFRLCGYLNDAPWNSVLEYSDGEHLTHLMEYYHHLGCTYDIIISSILRQMKFTLTDFYDKRKGLDRDVWYRNMLNLPPERINLSSGQSMINFYRIENIHNRELVKMWFKNLLGNTEVAYTTIVDYFCKLCKFCDYLQDMPLEDVDHNVFINFICSLGKITANMHNKIVNCLSDFFKYLAVKETYTKQAPILRTDFRREKKKHYNNSVSEYVILQIFKHLHELPFELMLMYLVNYSTGMRISDICQLPLDCLIKSEKCYFLRFHIQKLQKDHAVPISTALGELIEKQIQDISKLNYKETYLFFGSPNTPRKSRWYLDNMKRWCSKWKIKNEDSTDYNFLTHSYRHTIASDLSKNYNVDLEIIQLVVLGHANIQMSLCYIDEEDEYKKMMNDKYINNAGGFTELESTQLIQPGWVKNNLSKQILPNGICSYPTVLGICPNADVCLSCEYFRTSKKFLDVHKQHLANLEKQIPTYEANGWVNNLETAKKQRETLTKIINSLEED